MLREPWPDSSCDKNNRYPFAPKKRRTGAPLLVRQFPDVLAKDYERLWTDARRKKVIDAAVKNSVAIELNSRYRLPSPSFVAMAKAAGSKFTFGTNNAGSDALGRSEYGLRMVEECKLVWQDFFVPGAWGPKAIERKGAALKG